MSDTVKFVRNVPVEVALVYGQGKIIETAFGLGGKKVMFTLLGGKVMFLDLQTAQKITDLGVKARQNFFICKYQEKRGELDYWRVWLPGHEVGEQEDGSFVVPAGVRASSEAAALTPGASCRSTGPAPSNNNGSIKPPGGNGNGKGAPLPNGRAQFLLERTNDLVDVYAAALGYSATKYGSRVTPEDVRALLAIAVEAGYAE